MFDYSRTTALVTGASSGIGETFAEMLAQRGASLVLVARTANKLEALAARLRSTYKIEAAVIAADLADPLSASKIHAETKSLRLPVNLVVNNAGFALAGAFLDHDLTREQEQIAVNVTALTTLSHLFAGDMRPFGRNAGIINISSSAAFQPLPYSAVYAASKSYVLLFSEALGRELREQGTHVLAVCPGPVKTAFFDKIGSKLSVGAMDSAESIVKQALSAFEKRKAVVIPGRFAVRFQAFGTRLFPRTIMVKLAEKVSRRVMMAGHD